MSDFYLLTRAAYAKLSRPVAKAALRMGLTPDSITAQTPYGELVRLAPPVKFSETKAYWTDPLLVVRGSSKPRWKDS